MKKMKLDKRIVDEITKATNRNDHTFALEIGAIYLDLLPLTRKLEALQILHKLEGYMPDSLIEYRGYLKVTLRVEAKKLLSNEDFEKFWAAF